MTMLESSPSSAARSPRPAAASRSTLRLLLDQPLMGVVVLRRGGGRLTVVDGNECAEQLLDGIHHGGEATWLSDASRELLELACDRIVAGEASTWQARVGLAGGGAADAAVSLLSRHRNRELVLLQLVDRSAEAAAQARTSAELALVDQVIGAGGALDVVVDSGGTVQHASPAVECLTGASPGALVGTRLDALPLVPGLTGLVAEVLGGAAVSSYAGERSLQAEWVVPGGRRRATGWIATRTGTGGDEVLLRGVDLTRARLAHRVFDNAMRATSGIAIIATDARGIVTFFNPGAEEMLGYRQEEVVGLVSAATFYDPAELAVRARQAGVVPDAAVIAAGLMNGEAYDRQDWTYVAKDERRITVSLTSSMLRGADGEVVGYLGVAEDVTATRRAAQRVEESLVREREAVERLSALDRAKDDFVSCVSHELRTPITSVLGYAEMLRTGEAGALSDQQGALLAQVERNGRRLLTLIEDLFTLSQIDGGSFSVEHEPVDLGAVVRQALTGVEEVRRGRTLDVVVDVPEEPVRVVGDHRLLVRVAVNLLSNAVKFTPDGGRVEVSLEHGPDGAVLVVEDTGMGIAREEQGSLFRRFFRSTEAQLREVPGAGLGLAIARSVVDGHGGSIQVLSEQDRGTRVEVRLPRRAGAGPLRAGA